MDEKLVKMLSRGVEGWSQMKSAGQWANDPFGGKRVSVVQIGLGTFGTFMQNLVGDEKDCCIDWLLGACSEKTRAKVTGIAVEPMPEHIDRLRPVASQLPGIKLVQVAIGEEDASSDLYAISSSMCEVALKSAQPCQLKTFEEELLYIRNMSCVGAEHHDIEGMRQHFSSTYGVSVKLEPIQIQVWSYARLARELDFCGCEVLLIDAEGYDCQILRSMVNHCEKEEQCGREAWPNVVQFETMGHCDRREGDDAELRTIKLLEHHNYVLLYWTYYNTVLVRKLAWESLTSWVDTLQCEECTKVANHETNLPFTGDGSSMYCWQCYKAWTTWDSPAEAVAPRFGATRQSWKVPAETARQLEPFKLNFKPSMCA